MNDDMRQTGPESNAPVVFERDGRIFTNSRDVATHFAKRHADVMRSIEGLGCSAGFRERNFAFSPYRADGQAREYPSWDMTKDGFGFLVMGFTGAEAGEFKERYIDQFNAMESALKNRAAGFAIPTTLSEALRLAADQADTIEKQKAQIAQQAPKVDGFDRIANAEGSMCITDAAKILETDEAWRVYDRLVNSTPLSVKRIPSASKALWIADKVDAFGSEAPRSMLFKVAKEMPAAAARSDCFMLSMARAPRICDGVIMRSL